jgi:hypothetical protein
MSDTVIYSLGVWAMICAGFTLLIVVQSLLLVAVGWLGKDIWRRVARVYALHVIWYWLNRLEKEGVRCFPKAGEDQA